ncbi:porin [Agrobacterium sp. ES01]|uniref:porin n=1 Tax=Agrobacterium sp. ES01 TaxID=3420714 RepID=UPI003D0B931F
MNIKSLLLGSAAALAAVSGAQAADAIVAAAPEPMEYVRVCDAFGTGYFYIPGTETCLQISGAMRFQVDFGTQDSRDANGSSASGWYGDDWDMKTLAWVNFSAKSDTELGVLESYITFEMDTSNNGGNDIYADSAYIALGGFQAGWFYSWWDSSIAGETDSLGDTTEFVSVAYTYAADAFTAGISLDELEGDTYHDIGVTGYLAVAFGPVSANLLGSYDNNTEEGAIRGIVKADVGPGSLQVAAVYSTGDNAYWDQSEWSIAASYALKATEKLTITPSVQYWDDYTKSGASGVAAYGNGEERFLYGVTFDYYPVENLLARATVEYDDVTEDFGGYFRLQRSF